MRSISWFTTTFLLAATAVPILSKQPMYVAICNIAKVDERILAETRREVEVTFGAAGAGITWIACENIDTAKAGLGNRLFTLRLRGDKAWFGNPSVSLETMGRAYTEERGSGYLADIFLPSILQFREDHTTDLTTLLGLVVCHELGHLLLGPGHTSDGIMVGRWSGEQTEAGRKRRLRFTRQQATVILRELDKRTNSVE